jgi:hypothetical protein
MAFVSEHKIYDALPISNDALDRGGVELLRAGVVDEELFITARPVFPEPAHWGWVLADITRRLASIYAMEGKFTEAEVSAAIAGAFARSFRKSGAGTVRPAKTAPPLAKARAKPRVQSSVKSKPSTKAVARRKGARAKS